MLTVRGFGVGGLRVLLGFVVVSGWLAGTGWGQDLAIVGATVYVSPTALPISRANVLIERGKIAGVGRGLAIPAGVTTLACGDCFVFAGFWNAHVHLTEAKWQDAAQRPAAKLTGQMQTMLKGFTTVVDTSSDPGNTVALRRRIERGEVLGPRIYTAEAGLYPPHAVPFYLQDLPPEVLARLPQPDSAAAAKAAVDANIAAGADLVKLFTGSYVSPERIVSMPPAIARAAVEEGHAHGQLVFAHPSNLEGIQVALESGVDVLAHAPDTPEGVDRALLQRLVDRHVAMVPTLKLFSGERSFGRVREIVARFHGMGGQLIFGTDTGFLTDYDVAEEYRQLGLAGLSFRDVLAMLTTAPAERFRVADHVGRLERGMDGDVTVLSADPAAGNLTAFTRVRYAVRGGRVIFGEQ